MSSLFASFVNACRHRPPSVAVVLGSGFGDLAQNVSEVAWVLYGAIPNLAAPTTPGHDGRLSLCEWQQKRILLFAGRLHFYEGLPWRRVVAPVEVAHELGARILLLTNAAGGIREDLTSGSFLAIRNHLDWTRGYPWAEAQPSSPYSQRQLAKLGEAASELDIPLSSGTFAQVTGPSYETPAEIRALRACGVDAVGMSTAREAEAAHALGLECVALSCITNRAAGLSVGPITHEEVLATASAQRLALAQLIRSFLGIVT